MPNKRLPRMVRPFPPVGRANLLRVEAGQMRVVAEGSEEAMRAVVGRTDCDCLNVSIGPEVWRGVCDVLRPFDLPSAPVAQSPASDFWFVMGAK